MPYSSLCLGALSAEIQRLREDALWGDAPILAPLPTATPLRKTGSPRLFGAETKKAFAPAKAPRKGWTQSSRKLLFEDQMRLAQLKARAPQVAAWAQRQNDEVLAPNQPRDKQEVIRHQRKLVQRANASVR